MLQHLQRLTAWSAFHAVRGTDGKTPEQWYPLPMDEEGKPKAPPITEEEREELAELMRNSKF